jgi:hypothetical protein
MRNAPMNYQEFEASDAEWDALSEEQRLAIVGEHGFRKRPDTTPAKSASTSVAVTAKPAAIPAASPDPAPPAAPSMAMPEQPQPQATVPVLSIRATAEKSWRSSPAIREEFRDSF